MHTKMTALAGAAMATLALFVSACGGGTATTAKAPRAHASGTTKGAAGGIRLQPAVECGPPTQ